MREIKFRAWDKERKSMQTSRMNMVSFNGDILMAKRDEFRSSDIVIMQFTGLLDKNGREIYEGDIVVENSYPMFNNGLCNYRCVVIWDKDEACFGLDMYCVSDRVRGFACPNSISEYEALEVIGNIYENPELVK